MQNPLALDTTMAIALGFSFDPSFISSDASIVLQRELILQYQSEDVLFS